MRTNILALFVAVATSGTSLAQQPAAIAEDVYAVWERATPYVGCTEVNARGAITHRWRGNAQPGELPAFRFHPWRDGVLAKLPDPGVPFALFLEGHDSYHGGGDVSELGIKELARFPSLQYLAIHGTKVSPEAMKALATLPNLHTLDLSGTSVSPAAIRVLPTFKALHTVTLSGGYHTAIHLKELSTLKKITFGFSFQTATDEGMQALSGVSNLHALSTGEGARLSAAGFAVLADLKGLKRLRLFWMGYLTEETMREIGKAKSLESLTFGNSEISEAGMRELAGLENLRSLNLEGTRARDAGLKSLAGLKKLRTLDLGNTRITNAGLAELKALPELESLRLFYLPINNDGLRHIAALQGLRNLHIDTVGYAGPRLRALVAHPEVERLKDYLKLNDYDVYYNRRDTDRPFRQPALPALSADFSSQSDFTDEKFRAWAQTKNAREVSWMSLSSKSITDATMAELANFKKLNVVELRGTAVTDEGLKVLVGKNLYRLEIPDHCWTDLGFEYYLASTRPTHNLKVGVGYIKPPKITDVSLKTIGNLTHLNSLDLSYCKEVTDEGIQELAGLTNLHELDLRGTKLTDAGLKHLAGLKNLRTLDLGGTKITEEGLRALAGMNLHSLTPRFQTDIGLRHYLAAIAELSVLDLSYWKIGDAGLKELAHLKNLHSLDLRNTNVTDAGLKELGVHEGLRKLNLNDTKVTGTGFKDLPNLAAFRFLDLQGTKISDEGAAALAGMSRLETLDMSRTPVGDAGMKAIGKLKHLVELRLEGTAVTDAGLAHLTGQKLAVLEVPEACKTDPGLKHFLAATRPRTTYSFFWKKLSDAGIKELAGHTHVHTIQLSSTNMTEACLKELAGFKHLEYLSFGFKLTDAGVAEIARHKHLRNLRIGHANATEDDVKTLRAKLPGIDISR